MFGQEGRGYHAKPIVHVAGVVETAHCGVHNGIAGATLGPGLEVSVVVFPFDVCILIFEGLVHAEFC